MLVWHKEKTYAVCTQAKSQTQIPNWKKLLPESICANDNLIWCMSCFKIGNTRYTDYIITYWNSCLRIARSSQTHIHKTKNQQKK